MCSWGGHQLPILQLHAEFDLTQNPISVIVTGGITVSAAIVEDTIAYNLKVAEHDASDEMFVDVRYGFEKGKYGEISPSAFKGYTVNGIYAMSLSLRPSSFMGSAFTVSLAGNVLSVIPSMKCEINGVQYSLTGVFNEKTNSTDYGYNSTTGTVPQLTYLESKKGSTITVKLT